MAIKVLAIDDEEDYRVIIRDVLEGAGYEVKVSHNGQEALEGLESFKPEVILVDWMMPVMDGQTFVRNVRKIKSFKDLPIIMLTIKQTSDDELEALHFGEDDFIVKPFEADDLLSRMRAVLRRANS
mgnify:CR=1 FL=1